MIEITCKICRKKYKLPVSALGKTGKCSHCGNIMKIVRPQTSAGVDELTEPTYIHNHADAELKVNNEKLIGAWKGDNSTKIKAIQLDRPWKLLWMAWGGDLSFFTVTVLKKGRSTTLCRPVNVHHLTERKEGELEINKIGLLDLKVEVGGPDKVGWRVAVETLF